MCVCFLRFLPIYSGHQVRRMYQPAGVTQEEGHTGFLIHLPSAVRALIFLARRIQPLFPSLVDREVKFFFNNDFHCCSPLVWHFFIYFLVSKNPVYRDSNSRPNVAGGYEVTSSELPGRPASTIVFSRNRLDIKERSYSFPISW